MPKELKRDFIQVDERTMEDLLRFTQKFSQSVNYYRNGISTPAGNWTKFFPKEEQIKELLEKLEKEKEKPEQERPSDIPPHLALFLTFLELYKKPQEVINRITGRHLDFYYQEVLQLKKKSALPDKAHVLIELKKNASPISISSQHFFSAGKDKTGIELLYMPTQETVINTAKVASLRSLFLKEGIVCYAPIANSADGMGDKLADNEPKWYGFGHNQLPTAEVGFAIASPVLRMKEGKRIVTLGLTLQLNDDHRKKLNSVSLQSSFEVFISGEKNWLGPYSINSPTLTNNVLQFSFTVPASETAVVNYDAKIHGYSYTTQAPIIQVLLKTELDSTKPAFGYNDFKNITLRKIAIEINVSGITSLKLENDDGALDPKKAFLPFGPQPTVGSRFMVGCEEALSKKLSKLSLSVNWKDVPSEGFTKHYENYGVNGITNRYFTAIVSFTDSRGWTTNEPVPLFDSNNASSKRTFTFQRTSYFPISSPVMKRMQVSALNAAGSRWAAKAATKLMLTKPVLTASTRVTTPEMLEEKFISSSIVASEIRDGFITFSLEKDFLHSTYRKK
jgi:hypothetical protein